MSEYVSHFKESEFACKCCGQGGIQQSTREKAESARNIAGVPFIINSGYRCPVNQGKLIEAGLSELTSSHPKGYAIDVSATESHQRYRILLGLLKAGFNRIEIRGTWLHADDDPDKPPNLIFFR